MNAKTRSPRVADQNSSNMEKEKINKAEISCDQVRDVLKSLGVGSDTVENITRLCQSEGVERVAFDIRVEAVQANRDTRDKSSETQNGTVKR